MSPESRVFALSAAVAMVAACAAPHGLHPGESVPFPDGYRGWQHIKSMVIEPGHPLHATFGGIHHVYGNPAAIAGLERSDYADGAVFAFDLLAAEHTDHAITEGNRKVLGVMHRDAAAFPDTGGWGFAGFDDGGRNLGVDGSQCFQCHLGQRDRGYVFSAWRR